uniref:Uncharacterized protein n=1 Tax=viral metagenome TaxID=1070528 RepID=A0A6C0IYA7_9ZZZZ
MENGNFLQLIFDTVDNIMPGIIGFFSGVVVSSKKRFKKYTKYYQSINVFIKWFYTIFTLLYLIYLYKYIGKMVIESSIYTKLLSAAFNVIMLFSSKIRHH